MAKKTTNSSKKRKVPPKEVEQNTEEIEKKSVILADDDSNFSGEENASVSTEEDVDGTSKEDYLPETKVQTKEVFSFNSDGKYHNKQRCLILCTRGVTSRYRHLLEDLRTLIPHHKKDSKLDASKNDAGGIGRAVNDIAEMRGCNSVLLLECRKRQDAYLWVGHTGGNGGPSAKFLVENIHTMDELRLTGNCMKGSRPILTFDSAFQDREELKLLKCLFTDVFGSPRGHPKSKPFIDRVMSFYYADGKIWVRNYQIVEAAATNAKEAHLEKKLHGKENTTSLVEIGPRFVLNPIRIFRGSFGGQTLYQNANFVSPNAMRAATLKDKGKVYDSRKNAQKKRKTRKEAMVLPRNPLDNVFN